MPDPGAIRVAKGRIDEALSMMARDERTALCVQRALAEAPDFSQRLAVLLDQVLVWNEKVNLTAARSADELIDLYLADAVILAGAEPIAATTWVDVGSGGGAPAVPLSILRPDVTLTLVEPRQKRVSFLRSTLGMLQRSGVRVERVRSDALASGAFTIASSRATLSPASWLAEGARLARGAVWVLVATSEPPHVKGWELERDLRYFWPLTGSERRALRFVPK